MDETQQTPRENAAKPKNQSVAVKTGITPYDSPAKPINGTEHMHWLDGPFRSIACNSKHTIAHNLLTVFLIN